MDSVAIETIAGWLADSDSAVAFTGAGISTESGIPDFRSPGGIWTRYRTVYFDEFLASAKARHEYWTQKAEGHADFLRAGPNVGHQALARWETEGRLAAVITQNIDGLHQQSGSRRVLELHGTARQIGSASIAKLDTRPMQWSCNFRQLASCPTARAAAAG